MELRIESNSFVDEREIFEKYLYFPESKILLELYHLTFKNVILDYEAYIHFYENRIQEVNHSSYKFAQIINSSYLVLNNFLIQIYCYLIENEKKLGLTIENEYKSLDKIFGTYAVGKGKGKDSAENKNKILLKKISVLLNINFEEEIKEVKYLEILCRNFFSHGWHLLFLKIFIMDTYREKDIYLQYNENFNDDDDIIFIKYDNFNKYEEIKNLRENILNLAVPFKETNNLTFFLNDKNYCEYFYLENDKFIMNTACSRIYLKKLFFNKYSFLGEKDKRNEIKNMYISLLEIRTQNEKIININSIFKLIVSITKKIDVKM